MKTTNKLPIFEILYVLLLFYAVLGPFIFQAINPHFSEIKLYPLWKNDLFAFSPKIIRDYQILIHKTESHIFDPPIDFFKLNPTIEGKTFSPSLLITRLGKSLYHQQTKDFSAIQKTFHILVFRKYNLVEYSIHYVEWSPLERYQKQSILKRLELGQFKYSKL